MCACAWFTGKEDSGSRLLYNLFFPTSAPSRRDNRIDGKGVRGRYRQVQVVYALYTIKASGYRGYTGVHSVRMQNPCRITWLVIGPYINFLTLYMLSSVHLGRGGPIETYQTPMTGVDLHCGTTKQPAAVHSINHVQIISLTVKSRCLLLQQGLREQAVSSSSTPCTRAVGHGLWFVAGIYTGSAQVSKYAQSVHFFSWLTFAWPHGRRFLSVPSMSWQRSCAEATASQDTDHNKSSKI